jgi:hypothetical protein
MKHPKGREEAWEVAVQLDLDEGGLEEEDQVDFTIVMNKDIWLETVLIQDTHGAHTAELIPTQLKSAHI